MTKITRTTGTLATLGAALIFAGSLSAQDQPKQEGKPQQGQKDEHGHDHAHDHGDGHDHAPKVPGKLTFFAENKMHKANGSFADWKFTEVNVPTPGSTEGATVTMEINLASVDAGNPKLTAHLKAPDFFNIEQTPKATVKVHSAQKTGENTYTATADVTLVGITRQVPVEFTITSYDPPRFKGSATVKRGEFNIYTPYDPANDRSPKDEVRVDIEAELVASK